MTVIGGGGLLLNRLVCSGTPGLLFFLTFFSNSMRLLQVRAPPSGPRRETFPFGTPCGAQQGRITRPLHRELHGQIVSNLMFVIVLVVYPLLVLAGRGKRTKFLNAVKGGIT